MRIAILHYSSSPRKMFLGTKLLKKRGRELGHDMKLIKKSDCQLDLASLHGNPLFLHKGKPLVTDVVIVRPGFTANYDMEAGAVKHLQYCGYPVVNSYLPIVITKNKIRTMQYLAHHHIPIPRTVVVYGREHLASAIKRIGHFPLIVKRAHGTHGKGVIYVPDQKTLDSMMDMLFSLWGEEFLIQEYVEESAGRDLRVFIVGDRIVAAMERSAADGEFRANFHLGGSVSPVKISKDEEKIALKAAKKIGIEVCGVDILRTKEGPKIIEINSNPGFEGIMLATGVDIPGEIIKYAVAKAEEARC